MPQQALLREYTKKGTSHTDSRDELAALPNYRQVAVTSCDTAKIQKDQHRENQMRWIRGLQVNQLNGMNSQNGIHKYQETGINIILT